MGNERTAPGIPSKFDDSAREYFASATFAQKKASTQEIERQAINRWITHLGGIRLDKITAPLMVESGRLLDAGRPDVTKNAAFSRSTCAARRMFAAVHTRFRLSRR